MRWRKIREVFMLLIIVCASMFVSCETSMEVMVPSTYTPMIVWFVLKLLVDLFIL